MAQFTHDGAFALPDRLPFAAGASPFRIKGSALLDEVDFFRKLLTPAQLELSMARLRDPAFRSYVMQPASRTGWYDIVPLLYLTVAVAGVREIPLSAQLRENGAWHADQAFRGVSGFVLRTLSVEMLSGWLPRAAKAYHDFGDVKILSSRNGQVRVVRTGIPQFFVQMWATLGSEFLERSLIHAGAKNPRAFAQEAAVDGEVSRQKTYAIPFDILWDAAK